MAYPYCYASGRTGDEAPDQICRDTARFVRRPEKTWFLTASDLQRIYSIQTEQGVMSSNFNRGELLKESIFALRSLQQRGAVEAVSSNQPRRRYKPWGYGFPEEVAPPLYTAMTSAILMDNFVLTVYRTIHYSAPDGISVIHEDDCDSVERLDL